MDRKDRVGHTEADLYADLVAVHCDPLADIRILQHREHLSLIIKNGAVVANRLPALA